MYILFSVVRKDGTKMLCVGSNAGYFPPNCASSLSVEMQRIPFPNPKQRSVSESVLCMGQAGLSLPVHHPHTHTHAGRDRHSAPSSKNRDGQTFKSIVIPQDRNEKLMQCFLKAPAVGQTSD